MDPSSAPVASTGQQSDPVSGQPEPQGQAVATSHAPGDPGTGSAVPVTRMGRTWAALIAFAVILALLIVFITQNLHETRVHFLAWSGSFPLGVGILIAGLAGAAIVLLVGTIRIVQLRKRAKANAQNG